MGDFLGGTVFGGFIALTVLVFVLAFHPEKRQPFYDFVESLGDDLTDE